MSKYVVSSIEDAWEEQLEESPDLFVKGKVYRAKGYQPKARTKPKYDKAKNMKWRSRNRGRAKGTGSIRGSSDYRRTSSGFKSVGADADMWKSLRSENEWCNAFEGSQFESDAKEAEKNMVLASIIKSRAEMALKSATERKRELEQKFFEDEEG